MQPALQQKLKEYKKLIKKPGYVVELGALDTTGGNRRFFEDADDFCGIDCQRGPGVDIVADCEEVDRLFDFNPDTIICLDVFKQYPRRRRIVKAIRETLIPGGYLMVFMSKTGEGSCLDALFDGYEVLDVTIAETTICGIAMKPYKIEYDPKTNTRRNNLNNR